MDLHTFDDNLPKADCLLPEWDWIKAWDKPHFQLPARRFVVVNIGSFNIPQSLQTGSMSLLRYYEYLLQSGEITECFNLNEILWIRSSWHAGVRPPRSVLGWQSVVHDIHGNLYVPKLQCISGQFPVIYWFWVAYDFNPDAVIGRLKK